MSHRDHTNPIPCTEIPHEALAKLMASYGWDQAVIIYRKEGDYGGEGITCTGLGYRNARVADEMCKVIKGMMGMKMETDTLDAEIAAAKREMTEGPEGGDPDTGKKIIVPFIEKKRDRDRKPR